MGNFLQRHIWTNIKHIINLLFFFPTSPGKEAPKISCFETWCIDTHPIQFQLFWCLHGGEGLSLCFS